MDWCDGFRELNCWPSWVTRLSPGVQVKVAVARKADALIEAGGEEGERKRLHRVPLEAFSTMYSFCTLLAGYKGPKWELLTTKAAEDEVLSLRDAMGRTVMHWAAQGDSRAKLVGVIAARDAGLVNAKDNAGGTPLHVAAMDGSAAVALVLLAVGANTQAKNMDGGTPLHIAAVHNCEVVARDLLAASAAKDAKDGGGQTPLHVAAQHGSEAVARALLAADADTNAKDGYGNTPLRLAQMRGRTALVALLS